MGLLSYIVAKSVTTAAKNSTIKAVANATTKVIESKANNRTEKDDVAIKNGKLFIKANRSSEDYRGKDVIEIAKEFLGSGFESVTLRPVNKLNEWSKKQYGKIQAVVINGKSEFLGIKKFPASSYILIEYLDFKKTTNLETYTYENCITPGTFHSIDDIENMHKDIKSVAPGKMRNYCAHCGAPILYEIAKFCSQCGKEV